MVQYRARWYSWKKISDDAENYENPTIKYMAISQNERRARLADKCGAALSDVSTQAQRFAAFVENLNEGLDAIVEEVPDIKE